MFFLVAMRHEVATWVVIWCMRHVKASYFIPDLIQGKVSRIYKWKYLRFDRNLTCIYICKIFYSRMKSIDTIIYILYIKIQCISAIINNNI